MKITAKNPRFMNPSATFAVLSLALAAFGCNTIKGLLNKDKGEEAKTEAEPTAEAQPSAAPEVVPTVAETAQPVATAPTEIVAVNAADIKRFDDEQKLDAPAETKIKDKPTDAIKEPPSGEVVAVLEPGSQVKVLAERQGFTLVAFENKAKPGELLLGWTKTETVEPTPATAAASAAATVPAPAEQCAPGLTSVFVGADARCETVCTVNSGCPTGKVCSGVGKASTNGAPGAAIKFCAVGAAAPTPRPPSTAKPPKPAPTPTPPPPPKEVTKKKKPKKKANE